MFSTTAMIAGTSALAGILLTSGVAAASSGDGNLTDSLQSLLPQTSGSVASCEMTTAKAEQWMLSQKTAEPKVEGINMNNVPSTCEGWTIIVTISDSSDQTIAKGSETVTQKNISKMIPVTFTAVPVEQVYRVSVTALPPQENA